jgi:large subunit ribosomal protein L28
MSRICQLTGVKPLVGNNVSHSKRRTRRRFSPNLQDKRIFIKELNTWVKLRISTRALRNIEKLGAYNYIKSQINAGFDPMVWLDNGNTSTAQRGYRRVENVDKDGQVTYSISYEPENTNNKKVRLSSLFK